MLPSTAFRIGQGMGPGTASYWVGVGADVALGQQHAEGVVLQRDSAAAAGDGWGVDGVTWSRAEGIFVKKFSVTAPATASPMLIRLFQ